MYVGVDYYPEHWPKERWATDARLMRKAGFNVVRLAEFNWVNMEPSEGVYDFSLLDEVLPLLAQHGISVMLCTPTAVMPAWVARAYPETLAQQRDGTRLTWGVRKNNCFASGAYRLLSERITRAMAEHFADAPNVIGWQTDNEFGHPFCYCASCRAAFQGWLRARYGSLDGLNRAWGTHFWGHRVQDWAEITIPDDAGSHNPSACLDWQRFFSWLNARFQHDQTEILRAACPRHFITHNFMGLFKELDYYELARDVDFVSWDNYPVWGAPEIRYDAALAADVMRGLKQRNFWVMEQTAGPCGWGNFSRNVRPGELRSIALQQVAHGADGMLWFRWRTCTAGREQYWHGLLGHDGRALRRYKEAARAAADMHALAPLLAATTIKAEAAIIYDYDSLWALRIQPGFPENEYQKAIGRYYRALFRAGVNVDIVPRGADVSRYKLVLAPALHVLPDADAARLAAYVRAGGVLLADCRTAVKDESNLCHARTLPGLLAPTLGIEIEEYESVPANSSYRVHGTPAFAGEFSAVQYADWVHARTAEVLAGFADWHLRGYAVLTRHASGNGTGWYCGAVIKEDAFYDQVIRQLLRDARIRPLLTPPPGVEVSVRRGARHELVFLINHTEEPQTVHVPAGMTDALRNCAAGERVRLERHGVAVLRRVRGAQKKSVATAMKGKSTKACSTLDV